MGLPPKVAKSVPRDGLVTATIGGFVALGREAKTGGTSPPRRREIMSDYNPGPGGPYDKYGNTNFEPGDPGGRGPYILLGILVAIGLIGGLLYFNGTPKDRNATAQAPSERSMPATPSPSTPAPGATPATPSDSGTQKQ